MQDADVCERYDLGKVSCLLDDSLKFKPFHFIIEFHKCLLSIYADKIRINISLTCYHSF